MMDTTASKPKDEVKPNPGSEGPRPLNLLAKFDQTEEVFNYSQEVMDIA